MRNPLRRRYQVVTNVLDHEMTGPFTGIIKARYERRGRKFWREQAAQRFAHRFDVQAWSDKRMITESRVEVLD